MLPTGGMHMDGTDTRKDMRRDPRWDDHKDGQKSAHRLTLDGRRALAIWGVTDVDSYDEHAVRVRISEGILCVEGDGLHVKKLSLEEGLILIDGRVGALYYGEAATGNERGGFLARLLR